MYELKDVDRKMYLGSLQPEQIRELQSDLNKLGYPLKVDGLFGKRTLGAFNQFKEDYGLHEPNYIGVTTVGFLKSLFETENGESEEKSKEQQVINIYTNSSEVIWGNFNSNVSNYFTVGEVSKWSDKRLVKDMAVRKRAIVLAYELDKIRAELGVPIGVTSWYRPPAINAAVGGSSNSRHLYGDAADIYPINGISIWDFQAKIDDNWYGALGYGAKKGFVHLDSRNGKGWRTGGNKGVRWNY